MSATFNKYINILIDKQNKQALEDGLVGIQLNFTDTQTELSVQKTISIVNGQQTLTYKGNYLIIQVHFYSDYYKIFVTKEVNLSKAAEELYSGNASQVSVVSSRQASNVLLSTTTKENPSAADWKRNNLTCYELDITMEDKPFVGL